MLSCQTKQKRPDKYLLYTIQSSTEGNPGAAKIDVPSSSCTSPQRSARPPPTIVPRRRIELPSQAWPHFWSPRAIHRQRLGSAAIAAAAPSTEAASVAAAVGRAVVST